MRNAFLILTISFLLTGCFDKKDSLEKIVLTVPDSVITKAAADSVCTVDEYISDKHEHFNEILKSIDTSGYYFTNVVSAFKYHVTDTVTKLKSKDILIVNLGKDYGIEMHIKGLKKWKEIPFEKLVADSIHMIQYYQGPHVIKDDEIIGDTVGNY